MKKMMIMLMLLPFGVLSPLCLAQEKAKAEESQKAEVTTTPVKVQIVVTEFEGDKKVKSLPYTMYMNSINAQENKPGTWVKFRIGSRVPIYMGKCGEHDLSGCGHKHRRSLRLHWRGP